MQDEFGLHLLRDLLWKDGGRQPPTYVREARDQTEGRKYKLFAVEKSVCDEFSST
jgi:hypothetical protein